jgi:hypothetical protein
MLFAHSCWTAVLVAGLFAGAVRSVRDRPFVYNSRVRHIYPDGYLGQVEVFKSLVPKGAIFYIMDRPEYYVMGLWRRALYPDYSVIPVYDAALVQTTEYQDLANKLRISYVLCAGNPPPDPDLEWKTVLPSFPGSIPIVVGKRRNSNASNQ